jgi:hypothetical protein
MRLRCSIVLASLALAGPAFAAPSAADIAVAQRAFDDARELFRTDHFEAACDKFALSERLDPKLGTLLNLAICHEKIGRYALATTEFHDARSLAAAENKPDRVDFADKRIAAIAPHLALLRLHADPKNRAQLVVTVDDVAIGEAALESEIPVDAGTHHVIAKRGAAAPFSIEVTCASGGRCDATIPAFPDTDPPPATGNGHGGRIAGATFLGVAAAGFIVGGVFGVLAIGKRAKAEDLCAANQCASGQLENDRGITFAWTSNIALGASAAFAIVGLVLVIVDPGHKSPVSAGANGLAFTF